VPTDGACVGDRADRDRVAGTRHDGAVQTCSRCLRGPTAAQDLGAATCTMTTRLARGPCLGVMESFVVRNPGDLC
jgi:hypothetical protein